METDLFRGYGVEVLLPEKDGIDHKERTKDAFLTIRETLERIGIPSKKSNTLYQSCHILHKRSRFGILHFKELFLLDGKAADFTEEDRGRRNTIVALLEEWGLVKIINPRLIQGNRIPVKVLAFQDKKNWVCQSKYQIGAKLPMGNRKV